MHISATATASPPFEQSCTAVASPSRIRPVTALYVSESSAALGRGTWPDRDFRTSSWYSEPPSSGSVPPMTRIRSPSAPKDALVREEPEGSSPTTMATGEGLIAFLVEASSL